MALQVNGTNITDVKYNTNTVINKVQENGNTVWVRPYTYARGTLPARVASISSSITASELYSTRSLLTSDTVYHGETMAISAVASTGFSAPTVNTPVVINSNTTGANYVIGGNPLSYTFTLGSKTGISKFTVNRTTSPNTGGSSISGSFSGNCGSNVIPYGGGTNYYYANLETGRTDWTITSGTITFTDVPDGSSTTIQFYSVNSSNVETFLFTKSASSSLTSTERNYLKNKAHIRIKSTCTIVYGEYPEDVSHSISVSISTTRSEGQATLGNIISYSSPTSATVYYGDKLTITGHAADGYFDPTGGSTTVSTTSSKVASSFTTAGTKATVAIKSTGSVASWAPSGSPRYAVSKCYVRPLNTSTRQPVSISFTITHINNAIFGGEVREVRFSGTSSGWSSSWSGTTNVDSIFAFWYSGTTWKTWNSGTGSPKRMEVDCNGATGTQVELGWVHTSV